MVMAAQNGIFDVSFETWKNKPYSMTLPDGRVMIVTDEIRGHYRDSVCDSQQCIGIDVEGVTTAEADAYVQWRISGDYRNPPAFMRESK